MPPCKYAVETCDSPMTCATYGCPRDRHILTPLCTVCKRCPPGLSDCPVCYPNPKELLMPEPAVNPKEAPAGAKAPLDYLEPLVNPGVARAMKHGADKYGYRNYTVTPCKIRTYIGAVKRHVDAIAAGEDLDPDSGLSHWDHIIAGATCWRGAELSGMGVDNRAAVSTPRSDAVHRDGNQDAKSGDWQEPAGEPAPPRRAPLLPENTCLRGGGHIANCEHALRCTNCDGRNRDGCNDGFDGDR